MQVRILLLDPSCGDRNGYGLACKASTCGFESRPQLQYALVAQLEERRISTPGLRGFESCRELQYPTTYGELAERQGTAMLTRRDFRVGQVRLLHSPPLFFAARCGRSSTAESLASTQKMRVRFPLPAPLRLRGSFGARARRSANFTLNACVMFSRRRLIGSGCRSFKSEGRGSNPLGGTIPPSSNGRTPHFECGNRGSNP
jgi:hypothetical protein